MQEDANTMADGGQEEKEKQPEKTFTQAEIDALISERLKREREKYKDYDELKKMAAKWAEKEKAEMSEAEKLQAKIADFEKKLAEKDQEVQQAKMEALKLCILDELSLPKSFLSRIFGNTEEEIRADAAELKKLLGIQGKVGTGTNPPGVGTGEVNPWKPDTFNLTLQGKITAEDPVKAKRMKTEAGIKL